MTNKENTQMNSTEIELKAIAKAIGGSLKRAGHTVPHTTVLHAVSAALDKRDWHKVKAALTAPAAGPVQGSNVLDSAPHLYSERTLFALRLAFACGAPVLPVPADDSLALEAARAAFPAEIDGMLSWQGWNLPVTMNPTTSNIDAGDFKPESPSRPGRMTLRLAEIEQVLSLEVAYSARDAGWYLTQEGAAQAYRQLEVAVSLAELFPPALPGSPIKAEFWTDDRVVEAQFDARPFFMQASAQAVLDIINCGYRGDYPTDAIADYMSDHHLDEGVENGFSYIGTMQKTGRKDAPGFECSVDQESMLAWLDLHRQDVLAQALCSKVGFIHEEEEEFLGGSDGFAFVAAGQEYQPGARRCNTEDEAALVAYRELGLLQKALNNEL